jgi:hypothetical protein
MAGVTLVVAFVVIGITVVPTHVTPGNGSIPCGTVLRPDRDSEVAALCGPAGANQLHAVVVEAAVLAGVALIPLAVAWKRPEPHPALWAAWAAIMVAAVLLAVADLGWFVEYAPKRIFVDL